MFLFFVKSGELELGVLKFASLPMLSSFSKLPNDSH